MAGRLFGVFYREDQGEHLSCVFEDQEQAVIWAGKLNAEVTWDDYPFARAAEVDFFSHSDGMTAEDQRALLMAARQ